MKILRNLALAATAGAALIIASSRAAVTSYTDSGELLLGFRQAGATSDYILKIGLAGSLATSGTTSFSLGNFALDLQAAFGSNWFTATGGSSVLWSVFGDNTSGNGILYTGRATATPWGTFNAGQFSNAFNNVQQVTGNYNNQLSTSNSTVGLLESTAPASNPFSYASFQPGGANSGGISFSAWSPHTESQVAQNMYLDVLPGTASGSTSATQVPGYFSLTTNGLTGSSEVATLTYTATAVPEPSTWMALGLGGLVLTLAIRRPSRTSNS